MTASLPPQTFRNVTMIMKRHDSAAMTWAMIEADRMARGLDLPPAPKAPAKSKRAPKVTGPKSVTFEGVLMDARDPRNGTACTAPTATEKPKSAAGAASMRRKAMALCSCRLCALAMFPPLTFDQHAAFVGAIGAEHWEATHQGPRKLTTHDPDRETLNAYRATLAREAAHGTIFTPGWQGGTGKDYCDKSVPFLPNKSSHTLPR